MSDFLFRMVERAAGLATVATPQPPRTFPWMGSAEALPSQFSATAPSETQAPPLSSPLRQPTAKFNPATAEDARNRRSVDVPSSPQPSVPEVSLFPLENASETSQSLIQHSLAVQSKPPRDVKMETAKEAGAKEATTKETAPYFQHRFPENAEQAGHNVNVPHLPVDAAPSKQQPLGRRPDGPIITDHEAVHFPLEEPAQKTSIHTVQPATPLPRESRAQTADVRTPKPTTEPPVEVKIGRVEIHFDAPATPAASPAPVRPGGFSEYAELRRYASRKR